MNVSVIIPAAGIGRRFRKGADRENAGEPGKIEIQLAGKPVFLHAVELFLDRSEVGQVVLAVHPDGVDDFRARHEARLDASRVEVVAGSQRERWETVQKALEHVHEVATHVAVHDAARPLTSASLIDRIFAAASHHAAVTPGVPVSSTLKRVDTSSSPPHVTGTIDRRGLVAVQTPQVFQTSLLRRAYAAMDESVHVTDDAGLVEALGEKVYVVEGEAMNLKITRPADADFAAALLQIVPFPPA